MSRYRIIFSKTGLATFINHQDLPIIFSRSMKRAGVKLEFTQGFSPHPRVSFSVALAIGVTGKAEVADFWLEEGSEENLSRLNEFLPEGFRVLEYFEIDNDFLLGKQMKAASYELAFGSSEIARVAEEILRVKLTEESSLLYIELKENNIVSLTVNTPEKFSASYFVKLLKEREVITGWQDIEMTRTALGKIDEATNGIYVPRV